MKSSTPSALKKTIWHKKNIWAAVLFLLVAGGGAAWYFLSGAQTAMAQSTVQSTATVQTSTVSRGNIQISASGSGTLVAGQSVDLSFSAGGPVVELDVKLGDLVKTGQVIARVGNADLLESDVASLQLQLLEAKQTLTDLQQNSSLALADSYQTWIAAQATYNTALTANARTAYARCSQEVTTKYKAALDGSQAKLDELGLRSYGTDAWINAKNNYDTALANYTYCTTYTTTEKTTAQATLDVAKAALQQAETNYNTLQSASGIDPTELATDEAKVTSLETQLATAQKNLEGVTLTAPIDGKVVYLAAGKGTIVDTSKFVTIANISTPTVEVSVDETDMDKLAVGNIATVKFDALPDQTFSGKVVQVDPQLVTSGQYKVVKGLIELDANTVKTVQALPLGLNATITVIGQEAKDVLLVPVTALKQSASQGYTVEVVGADGQTKTQVVKVGLKDSNHAEILSGLNEGDKIVTIAKTSAGNSSTSSSKSSNSNAGMMPPDGGMPPGQ